MHDNVQRTNEHWVKWEEHQQQLIVAGGNVPVFCDSQVMTRIGILLHPCDAPIFQQISFVAFYRSVQPYAKDEKRRVKEQGKHADDDETPDGGDLGFNSDSLEFIVSSD